MQASSRIGGANWSLAEILRLEESRATEAPVLLPIRREATKMRLSGAACARQKRKAVLLPRVPAVTVSKDPFARVGLIGGVLLLTWGVLGLAWMLLATIGSSALGGFGPHAGARRLEAQQDAHLGALPLDHALPEPPCDESHAS